MGEVDRNGPGGGLLDVHDAKCADCGAEAYGLCGLPAVWQEERDLKECTYLVVMSFILLQLHSVLHRKDRMMQRSLLNCVTRIRSPTKIGNSTTTILSYIYGKK